jgi:hypothetical protein
VHLDLKGKNRNCYENNEENTHAEASRLVVLLGVALTFRKKAERNGADASDEVVARLGRGTLYRDRFCGT